MSLYLMLRQKSFIITALIFAFLGIIGVNPVKAADRKLNNREKQQLNYYLEQSRNFSSNDNKLALLYADSAYTYAEKINSLSGMADALFEKSLFYRSTDNQKALKFSLLADSLFQVAGNREGEIRAKRVSGTFLIYQGRFPESLKQLQNALRLAEKFQVKEEIPKVYNNLSVFYNLRNETDKARVYLYMAIKEAEVLGMEDFLSNAYGNLGIAYHHYETLDSAEYFYNKALAIAQKTQNIRNILLIKGNLGSVYENRYEYDRAIETYSEAEKLAVQVKDDASVARNMTKIGELWYKSATDSISVRIKGSSVTGLNRKVRIEKGIDLLEKALGIYRSIGWASDEVWVLRFLSEAYSLKGDNRLALEYFKSATRMNDSLSQIQKDKEIAELEVKRENELKDREIEILKQRELVQEANLAKERTRRKGLLVILGLISVAAVVFFRQRNIISKEKDRSEALLLNILPEEIADELKQNGQTEARLIQQVTVLFTDFKDFTQVAETMTPSELVAEINIYFSEFDRIMDKYGIEKIKTIGDAYMAAGGLPTENSTNHFDVAAAAIEIRDFIANLRKARLAANLKAFDIRIGIHTGPVVAGIVGVKKFAYDIWGDTVNTASRMESSGEPGKINISQDTYELVKDKYVCTYRGKLQAKHKGEMDMYFLEHESVKN